jgi:3-oxoacyl-[acyl-carrier protein] reductase
MGKLANKVAVVTGASKGIGAGIAKGFAAEGAAVAVNYFASPEGARRVVDEITQTGGKAVAIQADIGDAEDIRRLFAETRKAFGRLDILVNNAGIFEFSSLEEFTEDQFHRQFKTNVLGLLLATREAMKHFDGSGGSVINIGSAITTLNPPLTVIYTATKGATDSITRILAKELGPKKIRVNSINPGTVETEGIVEHGIMGSDMQKNYALQTPLGGYAQPEDIAPIAVFLASDDSRWLTGELITASGGLR